MGDMAEDDLGKTHKGWLGAAIRDLMRIEADDLAGEAVEEVDGFIFMENPDPFKKVEVVGACADFITFKQLAWGLGKDPRGLALLTGFEAGPAGIVFSSLANSAVDDGAARSYSFCLNGKTYTAFDDAPASAIEYGGCGGMSFLVSRDGNHCERQFEPCALAPRFRGSEWAGDPIEEEWRVKSRDPLAESSRVFELCVPGSLEVVLEVGTRCYDWDSAFIRRFNPDALDRARALGLALAYELDEEARAMEAPRGRSARL